MQLSHLLRQEEWRSYINGEDAGGYDDRARALLSASIGKPWKTLVSIDENGILKAIETAEAAQKPWRETSVFERAEILRKIASLILENRSLLARIMAQEMGKPIREGEGEVKYAAGFFSWFAGEAERIRGDFLPSRDPSKQLLILREPVGVCALITPWNFPLAMPARKLAAAFAAGCTVILKPALESPISALLLARIAVEAGLPPGVFNVLIGDEGLIGETLLHAPEVKKLSFTGSVEVGKKLYSLCSRTVKKMTLELGGHAPFIVCEDADPELALEGLIASKFRNNGQTCVCPNRIFVHEKHFTYFVEQLPRRLKTLVVGDPLNEETDLSNTLHEASQRKVAAHLKDAEEKGAKRIEIGDTLSHPKILLNITPDMLVSREETFGPVVPIARFQSLDTVIDQANQTPYGLAAYCYSQSLKNCTRLASCLQYGIIGLNDPLPSSPEASFGGIKQSGFGREGGPDGIYEYLNDKFLSIKP